MKVKILKSLANPIKIFYVPYNLAILNFIIQFIIHIFLFIIILIISYGKVVLNPLYFLFSVVCVHIFFIKYAKKEPHLFQIIKSKLKIIKFIFVKRFIV